MIVWTQVDWNNLRSSVVLFSPFYESEALRYLSLLYKQIGKGISRIFSHHHSLILSLLLFVIVHYLLTDHYLSQHSFTLQFCLWHFLKVEKFLVSEREGDNVSTERRSPSWDTMQSYDGIREGEKRERRGGMEGGGRRSPLLLNDSLSIDYHGLLEWVHYSSLLSVKINRIDTVISFYRNHLIVDHELHEMFRQHDKDMSGFIGKEDIICMLLGADAVSIYRLIDILP